MRRKGREIYEISIPAPARGATTRSVSCSGSRADFNSRPCERGDDMYKVRKPSIVQFQFPPLREGRLSIKRLRKKGHIFQFPPLREGRPWFHFLSICTPSISIPAPARGATGREKPRNGCGCNFNSRPCERGDALTQYKQARNLFQFPPLREGRPAFCAAIAHQSDFNSRPCERGDGRGSPAPGRRPYFNSRPCERGDVRHHADDDLLQYFNSRPCERGDVSPSCTNCPSDISIPAPARGATHQAAQRVAGLM